MRGTILACLSVMLAPAATAQKLRSAEDGQVPLTLDAFMPQQPTLIVRPGETAWTEGVRPAYAVRLLDQTETRVRPTVEGVPAGTLLFAYRLSSGYAYCPPLDVTRPTKDVQCYRDVDNDGKFDGGYVTGERNAESPYFSTFLKSLAATPKYRYEHAFGTLLPPAPARVVFAEMKNGAPRFRLYIGREQMKNLIDCEPAEAGVCDALGVRLSFAPADGQKNAITLTFQGAVPERGVDVMNTVNPLKP